jgi:hypothetical protein
LKINDIEDEKLVEEIKSTIRNNLSFNNKLMNLDLDFIPKRLFEGM